jgi:signal transduction histidine kinase
VELSLLRAGWAGGYRDRVRRLLVPARALAYLASGIPVGLLVLVLVPPLAATGVGLLGVALIGVPVGAVERYRLRLVDPRPAPSPHGGPGPAASGLRSEASRDDRSGPPGEARGPEWSLGAFRAPDPRERSERRRLRPLWREAATWQELGFALLMAVLLWPLELIVVTFAVTLSGLTLFAPLVVALAPAGAVPNGARLAHDGLIWLVPPLGVLVTIGMAYAVTVLAKARAALARAVLVGSPDLVELTRSRSRLVRGFDDERRRIERDLHDGVQQRLLALSVTLGLARTEPGAGELVVAAHEESKAILEQLRQLVRGIHPWILTDRGLPAAIDELAGRLAVPVRTDVALPGRFPGIVESTAYFVVSEALANVDRHSGAGQASVTGRYAGGVLTVDVRDDGRGGADPDRGTGLRGLADRAEAAGARLLVASPPGGPTLLRLEIPCTPAPG